MRKSFLSKKHKRSKKDVAKDIHKASKKIGRGSSSSSNGSNGWAALGGARGAYRSYSSESARFSNTEAGDNKQGRTSGGKNRDLAEDDYEEDEWDELDEDHEDYEEEEAWDDRELLGSQNDTLYGMDPHMERI
jgi:hypothetical protein